MKLPATVIVAWRRNLGIVPDYRINAADFDEDADNLSRIIRDRAGRVKHPLVEDSSEGLSYKRLSDLRRRGPRLSADHRVARVDDAIVVCVKNYSLTNVLFPCIPTAVGSIVVSSR